MSIADVLFLPWFAAIFGDWVYWLFVPALFVFMVALACSGSSNNNNNTTTTTTTTHYVDNTPDAVKAFYTDHPHSEQYHS